MEQGVVLLPVAEAWREPVTQVRSNKAGGPAGKRIAIINNTWSSMGIMARTMGEELKGRHEAALVEEVGVPLTCAAPDATLDRVEREADLAIVGLAN